ncbi:MAG: adenylate/guanylate cyclase domain-containing protein, partial [Actinomycetota bacterium]|nr:adenylate/guanylate cyclase domain-containing protein [Actinomycetota bacterium]
MRNLPSGNVALLFSDIEGSTRLLLDAGDRYVELLDEHRQAMRSAFARHGGAEVDTQGDAFFVAFSRANDAVAAAADAQRSLADGPVRVRIGVHFGQPVVVGEGYVGLDVHRGARICAAAHGGQVLLSGETVTAAGSAEGFRFEDLGEHRIKDLPAAERLFQLAVEGIPSEFPPPRTLERPTNLPAATTALIGRERELAEVHDLLGSADTRLVTLTGPGGVGKTRLAIEVARSAIEPLAKSGVFMVDLATLRDAGEVPAAVARVLSVREETGRSIVETLA